VSSGLGRCVSAGGQSVCEQVISIVTCFSLVSLSYGPVTGHASAGPLQRHSTRNVLLSFANNFDAIEA
jgi:hypothetical protein